jgi:hypothetical protein
MPDRKSENRNDTQRKLNAALAKLVGKRVTMFTIDWRVGLTWTDPGAGQSLIISTPFNVGPPGDEAVVIPGDYGPSIARVIGLLGETVSSAVTEQGILDLRIAFSNGIGITVVRSFPGWTGFFDIEWEYHDGPDGLWLMTDE